MKADLAQFRDLVVSSAFTVAGRGVAVLFLRHDLALLRPRKYQVEVTPPAQVSFRAIASAEYMRSVPPGDINALVFGELNSGQIPVGSLVTILGLADVSTAGV